MDISNRLKAVANTVKFNTIADIGTDHAYVPIYLAKKGVATKIIACDVNSGPLKKAKENISKNNFNNIITTRLGGGVSKLSPFEVETVVIAGMGGMLINSILEDGLDVIKSLKQLVLSPHLDVDKVRKYLHKIGFKIDNEEMIYDEGKYYTIISASLGEESYESEIQYLFGKINLNKNCSILKQYLIHNINRVEKLLNIVTQEEVLNEKKKELALYKEALNNYEM